MRKELQIRNSINVNELVECYSLINIIGKSSKPVIFSSVLLTHCYQTECKDFLFYGKNKVDEILHELIFSENRSGTVTKKELHTYIYIFTVILYEA